MIRKAVIVVLTLAAVGTGGLWLLSYVVGTRSWSWEGEDAIGELYVMPGHLSILLKHGGEDISANNPSFHYELAGLEITRIVGLQDMLYEF